MSHTDGSTVDETDPDAPPRRRRVQTIYTEDEEGDQFLDTTRRRAMAGGAATWATVSLAGCSAILGDDDGEDGAQPTPGPENYVVTDELISGSQGIPSAAGGFAQACAPQRQFVPGMHAIFKVGVFDPATGEHITNDTIDSMVVSLDSGPEIEMSWAGDDDENPAQEWSGSWTIPDDAEAGAVSYEIQISNSGNYRNVGVLENQFTIIEFGAPSTYVLEADTSTTSANIPSEVGGFGGACGPQQQFAAGMEVIFHVGVWDPSTGERVGPEVIDSLSIELDIGTTIEMEWIGDAEQNAAPEWEGSWTVPDDVEAGSIPYTVNLQTDASTVRVGVLSDQIQVVQWPPEE